MKVKRQLKYTDQKDIAHVVMQGTVEPQDILPGTEGDSDNQNVPPSKSSTFNQNQMNQDNLYKNNSVWFSLSQMLKLHYKSRKTFSLS